jgi:predicted DNA-binding transcriptional regulator YafY
MIDHIAEEKDLLVQIEYTNWRGERGRRTIMPSTIRFGTSHWHKEPQWLLRGFDISKGEMREFAMKDIHYWSKADDHDKP